MPHPRSSVRRTACDRCRHSKLKCFRDEKQQKCVRCLRLELRCEVAPAKPPGRPRKVVPVPTMTTESASHTNVSSPRLLENRSHTTSETDVHNSISPSQSPGALLPVLGDGGQVIDGFGPSTFPSYSNLNEFSLTPVPTIPEPRTVEWRETSRFDSEVSPSRDLLDTHTLFTVKLDRHECLKELSQLNVDIHTQCLKIQELKDSGEINFAAFCDHPPPPVGDGVSLAEKYLIMSQRFQQAITNINWVVKKQPRPLHAGAPVVVDADLPLDPLLNVEGPLPTFVRQDAGNGPNTPEDRVSQQDGLLETPFACLLVSCYLQLIDLWETMYFHVRRRTSGVDQSQLHLSDPSKGVQMGAFCIFGGRLQSMFFCQAVLYFQGNIDRGLGILPEQRENKAKGLLSHPQHFDFLQRELGGQVSKGENERVRALRDLVEKTRVIEFHDVGW
ncbi:hypothetical protein F4804DRAFT_42777 [Jackrogersella minutella]|nr:hypothetical protein F4804DRAFT_42777 [Jackrogersella minutella]